MEKPHAPTKDRRRIDSQMSDDQFKQFTLAALNDGHKKFEALNGKIDAHFKIMSKIIGENTAMTQRGLDIATKTAKDTEGLVKFYQFGEKAGAAVSDGTRRVSRISKLMTPIIILGLILTLIWHGEPIHWKDVLEAAAK